MPGLPHDKNNFEKRLYGRNNMIPRTLSDREFQQKLSSARVPNGPIGQRLSDREFQQKLSSARVPSGMIWPPKQRKLSSAQALSGPVWPPRQTTLQSVYSPKTMQQAQIKKLVHKRKAQHKAHSEALQVIHNLKNSIARAFSSPKAAYLKLARNVKKTLGR